MCDFSEHTTSLQRSEKSDVPSSSSFQKHTKEQEVFEQEQKMMRNSETTEFEEYEDEENVREADQSFHDQMIPSAMQDPEYAALLERIQYMENDEDIMECLASYEQQKQLKQREEKYNQSLIQLKHEQALQSIREKIEMEKTRKLVQQDKDNRRKQVQSVLMWLARNKTLNRDELKLELHSNACNQMERFIEKKQFLDYEIYEYIQEETKDKFSSILDEITNFPAEEDEEYEYDD